MRNFTRYLYKTVPHYKVEDIKRAQRLAYYATRFCGTRPFKDNSHDQLTIDSVMDEIKSHRAATHPFLTHYLPKLGKDGMSKLQFEVFRDVFLTYTRFTIPTVTYTAFRASIHYDDKTVTITGQNLFDESGYGDPKKSHPKLLVKSLGIHGKVVFGIKGPFKTMKDVEDSPHLPKELHEYAKMKMELFDEKKSYPYILGNFFSHEILADPMLNCIQYGIIMPYMGYYTFQEDKDGVLEFFLAHRDETKKDDKGKIEEEHGRLAKEAIIRACPDVTKIKEMRKGALVFADAQAKLWDGLMREIEKAGGNSKGGTVGVSKFFKKGYFGISATNYQTNYGTVAEEEVTIDMEQKRLDIAGSFKEPLKYIKEVKYKAAYSNYEHTEFEGEEAGTVFENEGYSSRVEILHDKLGLFEGAIGLQSEKSDFSALGEEAYLPPSTTYTNSAFIFEEIPFDKLTLQLGGRLDYQTIDTDQNDSFGAAQSRDDLTGSGSIGAVYKLPKGYSTALSASYTQRAPNAQELYANGDHVATGTFEIGNKNLDVQQSEGLDLSFRKETGPITGEVNFFYNHFQDFITLQATGTSNEYEFVNLPAEFYGAEFKTDFKAYDKNSSKLSFEVRGDYVQARNRNTGEPLPRISPARIGGSAIYKYQKIGLNLDLDYTFAANHVPENETKTDGYTMLNIGTDYEINFGPTISKLYLQGTNLLNEEARNHVSFLKDQAPLAGRSIMIGIKTAF